MGVTPICDSETAGGRDTRIATRKTILSIPEITEKFHVID